MVDGIDRAREEFRAEAQEIVDTIGRDLLALNEGVRASNVDRDLINGIFRAVHTLKGLSGLFGVARIESLSHELEELLNKLRYDKVALSEDVLDLLFKSVDVYLDVLSAEVEGHDRAAPEVDDLIQRIQRCTGREVEEAPLEEYDLDPNLTAMLNTFEEHRLNEAVRQKLRLYLLRVTFSLEAINASIEELKATAKPHGELIAYLPTNADADAASIVLDVLMASPSSPEDLRKVLIASGGELTEVPRRARATAAVSSAAPGTIVADRAAALPASPDDKDPADVPSLARDDGRAALTQTVRVDIRKLDRLMNIVGELSLVRTALSRLGDRIRAVVADREISADLHRIQRVFERRLGEAQQGILEVRMVPLSQVFEKLARVVRETSRKLDKGVNLVITGAETEVDKLIVDRLVHPLMHMLNNAIDHGIEPQAERERAGKPALGTIALNAFQKGNHVLIEVEDDGRGMDPSKLVDRAVTLGLLGFAEARSVSDQEAFNLVFVKGFSTKSVANTISGRGFGMDVVKENINNLGGVIDIQSEIGIGTKMTITLPITLAIVKALIVLVEGQLFAIPLANVQEAMTLDPAAARIVDGREVVTLRGSTLQLCRLARIFGLEGRAHQDPADSASSAIPPGWGGVAPIAEAVSGRGRAAMQTRASGRSGPAGKQYVVVTSVGSRRLGLVVETLVGEQDVVIKALGPSLKGVRGFAGASELGDQRIALVIDASALVEETHAPGERSRAALDPKSQARRG